MKCCRCFPILSSSSRSTTSSQFWRRKETYGCLESEYLLPVVDAIIIIRNSNECGQCGNFIEEGLRRSTPQKVLLPMGEKVKQVDFGEYHTVVLTECGNIYAWGQVSNGKLGYEVAVLDQISTSQQAFSRPKPYLVKFNGLQNSQITKIACGRSHTICLDCESQRKRNDATN